MNVDLDQMLPIYNRKSYMNKVIMGLTGIAILGSVGLAASSHAEVAGCNASSLSNALGSVASQTGVWLDAHPEANDVITSVGDTGNKDAVRVYFVNHQSEWAELQGIAQPLRTLRQQCGGDGAAKATGIGDLYNAMSQ